MKQKNDISTINLTTKKGNTLSLFFNAHTNTLVVDLVHANEKGGSEIVRMVLDEDKLLAHCEPAIDIPAPKRKTPVEWCASTGVQVLDPDGWRHQSPSWETPITWDMFLSRFNESTVRIVDKEKYLLHKHLFR